VTNPEEMEIYELPHKEFKTTVLKEAYLANFKNVQQGEVGDGGQT
jgi:hypothetical protein